MIHPRLTFHSQRFLVEPDHSAPGTWKPHIEATLLLDGVPIFVRQLFIGEREVHELHYVGRERGFPRLEARLKAELFAHLRDTIPNTPSKGVPDAK